MAKYPLNVKPLLSAVTGLLSLAAPSFAAEPRVFEPTGSIPYLTVEESLKTFDLADGYRLEPVVTEPEIAQPVISVFDGNGRLYVAEMPTYMLDIEATGEQEPKSRVSRHEDTDGDGTMDKHTVFADDLLLPRMVLPLDDRILIQETNTNDIYAYRDTDGDGVSDEKILWYEGGPRGGNMEHQSSGLIWSLDNWIYTAGNSYRLRHNPEGLAIKEAIPGNGGQWGLCQDDQGKLWFTNAGGEIGPLNFQQPIRYGGFNVPNQFPVDYREVHPLVGLPDFQSGPSRVRPENQTLNHFTAVCGQEIFRGDRLPEDLRGDLLFSEPVGRLIRRSKVEVRDGITYLRNAHPGSEFIRSTDPNFRTVNMANGPDGCLYLVDLYHGVVQQGTWTNKGSYLRGVIDEYGLAKNVGRGRVYRLVHEDFEPDGKIPKMLDQSSSELVPHLEHPNGWRRDTAQKLLVLRGDLSVVPVLEAMARSGKSPLARLHALWTLEGLRAIKPEIVRGALADAEPAVRRGAVRLSEEFVRAGANDFALELRKKAADPHAEVATQALLSAKVVDLPDYREFVEKTSKESSSEGVKTFAKILLHGGTEAPAKLSAAQLEQYRRGQGIYETLCFACHGADGRGMQVPGAEGTLTLAPSFADSAILSGHRELATRVVLHGLSGPIDGKTYPGEMIAMGSNDDEWIADVISFIRNSFGNQMGFITPQDVAGVRQRTLGRKTPWTHGELLASVPNSLRLQKDWKITASHGEKDLKFAFDADPETRYSTGKTMEPGMWLQIELPQAIGLTGVIFDAGKSKNDYPRGYLVELSLDRKTWKEAGSGVGSSPLIEVTFPATPAQWVRITQTGTGGPHWSIHELELIAMRSGKAPAREELETLGGREQWKLSASHGENSLKNAIDGDQATRYSANTGMTPGMWLQIELPSACEIAGLELDFARSPNDYPRGFLVERSADGKEWGEPAVIGQGKVGEVFVGFTPQVSRFVRITQLGSSGNHWSIHELNLLGVKGRLAKAAEGPATAASPASDPRLAEWRTKAEAAFKGRPDAGDQARIEANLPPATVKTESPRKVLVFYRCEGFIHSSISFANHALKEVAESTGAFQVDFADDYSALSAANLSRYDVLLFNNTTGLRPDETTQKALLAFVREGKGIVGIHGASDNFQQWPEGAALMGGIFNGHPWGGGGTWAFKIEDPGHPLNRAFENNGFWHSDEIYRYRPESFQGRDRLRVLLSLDMSKSENRRPLTGKDAVADPSALDIPVSWCRAEGKGRVFYTNLGHNPGTFENRTAMQHLLDGIQYAAGDLAASDLPSTEAKVSVVPAPDLKLLTLRRLFPDRNIEQVPPASDTTREEMIPLAGRQTWKLTADHGSESTPLAVDGKAETRYTSQGPMKPGMSIQVELPMESTLSGVELDHTPSRNDYPRGCVVELSRDGKTWSGPVALADGGDLVTWIPFAPQAARYVKVTQLGEAGNFWSIHELHLFGPK